MKRKGETPAPLSSDQRAILLYGPWHVGKLLIDLPPHNQLRRLWAAHGAALTATLPRGRRAWFLERDHFVRALRGEAP